MSQRTSLTLVMTPEVHGAVEDVLQRLRRGRNALAEDDQGGAALELQAADTAIEALLASALVATYGGGHS